MAEPQNRGISSVTLRLSAKSEPVQCGRKNSFQTLLPIPEGETGLCSGVPFLIGKKITSVLRMRKSGRRLAFGGVLIDVGFLVRHSTLFCGNGGALLRHREGRTGELIFKMALVSHTS